jgi:hypothetical protein
MFGTLRGQVTDVMAQRNTEGLGNEAIQEKNRLEPDRALPLLHSRGRFQAHVGAAPVDSLYVSSAETPCSAMTQNSGAVARTAQH